MQKIRLSDFFKDFEGLQSKLGQRPEGIPTEESSERRLE